MHFVGQSRKKLSTKGDEVKRNIRFGGTYSINKHQYRTLFKNGRRSINLNSGFVDESLYPAFEELMMSEFVWMTQNGITQPIVIKTSSLSEQKQNNESLINYQIEVELAHDVINNFS